MRERRGATVRDIVDVTLLRQFRVPRHVVERILELNSGMSSTQARKLINEVDQRLRWIGLKQKKPHAYTAESLLQECIETGTLTPSSN